MQHITVQLGTRSYPIFIGSNLLPIINSLLSPYSSEGKSARQLFIITNNTLASLHLPALSAVLSESYELATFIMEDGETYKNLDTYQQATQALIESGFGRDCTVVAFGGGVVGDLAGFVAATYQRGVAFIQIPTSLLAQVDSSVGGKTAVNHTLGKNLLGAFHQPVAVVIDSAYLQTLPARELRAGLAEVIKYGVMADANFFEWLESNITGLLTQNASCIEYAIATSCQIKAAVVEADEHDHGQRALLNLGHTFGHAIETFSGYNSWLHGEAVAAGMAIAAQVSVITGRLPEADYKRIVNLLKATELPVNGPVNMTWETWHTLMARDKKVTAGKIQYVLPSDLGNAMLVNNIDTAILQRCVAQVR